MTEKDTSLRPRPGESAAETLGRVVGAVREERDLVTIYVCSECEAESEDFAEEPLYECGRCGQRFLGIEGNRCPTCNIFAARVETEIGGCVECQAGEVEVLKTIPRAEVEAERKESERVLQEEKEARARKPETETVLGRDLRDGDTLVEPMWGFHGRQRNEAPSSWNQIPVTDPREGDGSPFGGETGCIVSRPYGGGMMIVVGLDEPVEILPREEKP